MASKQNKNARLYDLYQAEREGVPFRPGAKDGSIPTHPVVPCPDIPEQGNSGVQDLCDKWLTRRRIMHDLHECDVGPGGALYGIKGAGDIIGVLRGGRHFEIECKRGRGGRLSKKQQERQEKVLQSNGIYVIVHGIPELEHYFKGLL